MERFIRHKIFVSTYNWLWFSIQIVLNECEGKWMKIKFPSAVSEKLFFRFKDRKERELKKKTKRTIIQNDGRMKIL